MQGTTSEAVLVAMLAAKGRVLKGQPPEATLKLVAYASDQTHSCFQKACLILGLQHVRILPTTEAADWALQPEVLEEAVQQDIEAGLIPFYAVATVGTTSSCAVDPLDRIAAVTSRYNIWLHVDAAWAGSAAICPEQRHWFRGLDQADSYSFNPHKWLLTVADCCTMWVADTAAVRDALTLTPAYLRGVGNEFDLKDMQLPLSRRFRSLKLWLVLRMYGLKKLRELIRHHLTLADWFAAAVAADARFEIAAPPRFGLTCFRLKGVGGDGNLALLERINSSGKAFMISTELGGKVTLRFAVGSSLTQMEHVQEAWGTIQAAATAVLASTTTRQPPAANCS